MRKVAIVRRNGLGDLLLTMPLLHVLKNEETSIMLFVDERNAPLLPYLPQIFDKHAIIPKKGNKYLNLLKIAFKYRKEKFDIAISAKTSPMKFMNFFLFALGGKRRIAFVDQKWSSIFINEKIVFNEKESNETHQALKVLKLIGHETLDESHFPLIYIKDELKEKYPSPCKEGPIVLMSATTTNPLSRIDPFKYASAINRLGKEFSFSLLLLGEKKDEKRLKSISENLTVPHVMHCPQNFEEFMTLQSYCDLFFLPDGGMAHIGAGLKKKQVVLFGSTLPSLWAPLSKDATILFHKDHVDQIRDEDIDKALRSQFCGVMRGRIHQ